MIETQSAPPVQAPGRGVENAAGPKDPVRRAIDQFGLLRTAVKSRTAQQVIESVRGARAVKEPLEFFARQFGSTRRARYRLRGSDQVAFIRNHSRDVHVLNEIFGGTGGRLAYEPPSALSPILDRNPSPKILDLGGNIGMFGLYALHRWPGASVRSFEPDAENARLLGAAIAGNRLQHRWTLTPAAVSNRSGTMGFRPGLCADSHLVDVEVGSSAQTADGAVEVPVEDLFALDGHSDLVKMDIEGGEWSVLADPRMAQLDADLVVLEWHDQGCPAPDARTHVIRLLRAAGYGELYETIEPSHCGMLWARRGGVPAAASPSVEQAVPSG
jgi:FkbM family methyltransferase